MTLILVLVEILVAADVELRVQVAPFRHRALAEGYAEGRF